ncbi:hypothetical protein BN1708_014602 [Verticillium longisporum]|uniref:Homeobox domain-containing protein n=3 Tax=Verticillium longisporum TaxID=100787 RepID=A0A0G4LXD0_VERLO|nr:putative mating-type protein A2 like [Verticillium longisporum]CRK26629.1 hypothetical protein BN1708_014602 [Verticillium longisporum]
MADHTPPNDTFPKSQGPGSTHVDPGLLTLVTPPDPITSFDNDLQTQQAVHAPDGMSAAGPGGGATFDATPLGDRPTKVFNRFTASSVRVLRNWIAAHVKYPYASPKDLEMLQDKTGLTKLQVTNWLANTRRRSKLRPSQSSSPIVSPETTHREGVPIEIPSRRPTPVPFEQMNILQRWESSPPEHEAADMSDISRAIAAASGSPRTPYYSHASDQSLDNASSISSAGRSRSSRGSGSRASSRNSAISSTARVNRRRRRAPARRQQSSRPSLIRACHMYQCTFCIETFKHKYDWQRHEKSLHLSLEEWICSPTGATAVHPDTSIELCVYCGAADPDAAHVDQHNHAACLDRSLSDRTYYRKDHLQQHLKLVHGSKFMKWPMDQWKVSGREIRSRCGFCDASLTSWDARVDHLAAHFKSGNTMDDWKGTWGFDPQVVETVENAMPPYLIHYEQKSPLPISSMMGPPDTPTSAYELVKLELEHYMRNYLDTNGSFPSDQELQFEGCSIIFGAEVLSPFSLPSSASWLRDVFMASETSNAARLLPMQQVAKSRLTKLTINGKSNIFDNCELELEMHQRIVMHGALGLVLSDYTLQQEASEILESVETCSPNPSKLFKDFLLRLVWGSSKWLEPLRQRDQQLSTDEPRGILAFAHQRDTGHTPLGQKPPEVWPEVWPQKDAEPLSSSFLTSTLLSSGQSLRGGDGMPFLLNDHNSYSRLTAGLTRFVVSAMSPNNPKRHVPTDEEIQYEARWLWYDSDDPWDQTPADNTEWLREFKRGVGLIQQDSVEAL